MIYYYIIIGAWKVFYQIEQYGKNVTTHTDIETTTEQETKDVGKRVIETAKKFVSQGKMVKGDFDVIVCLESGHEVDHFVSCVD